MSLNQTGLDLGNFLSYLSQRQEVISSHIANADTPGYKTRDVEMPGSFSAEFQEARASVVDAPGLVTRNDGNNVSMDRESLNLAEAQLKFKTGVALLRQEYQRVMDAIHADK